jgi:hypothetical protein
LILDARPIEAMDAALAKGWAHQRALAERLARSANAAGWDEPASTEPPPLTRRERAQRRLYRMTNGCHQSDWWILALAALLLLCWRLGVFAD